MTSECADLRQAAIVLGLRQCELFVDCSGAVLNQIADFTTMRTVLRSEYLFQEGTPSEGFYVVQQGAINLHRRLRNGKEELLHIFRRDESLAEETLGPDSSHWASAVAVEESRIWVVERAGFLSLIEVHPELSLSLLRGMGRRVHHLIRRLDDLTLKDVESRLAGWLLQHCPDPDSSVPHTIRLPETKRLLAAELGTCSATFSRTLASLREQRLLSVRGRTVTLLCPSRLTEWLSTAGMALSRAARRRGLIPEIEGSRTPQAAMAAGEMLTCSS